MRRRKRVTSEESHERWLVSYADYITLLFAFFTILFATSKQDTEKSQQFEESVKKYLIKFGAFGESGQKIHQGVKNNTVLESPIKKYNRNTNTKTGDALYNIETYLESKMTNQELNRIVSEMTDDVAGVRISVSADEIFVPGSAKMLSKSIKSINRIAEALKQTQHKIYIEGHTDDRQLVNSQFPTHWDLASKRATIMVRYLIKLHDFNPKRLAAISFGKQKPVIDNSLKESQRRNNRLDFLIVTAELPL